MSDPIECLTEAVGHLNEAVEHLNEAVMRSKRQESVYFWDEIEKAKAKQREARRALADVVITPIAAE